MGTINLVKKVDRKTKAWKITSIRIPYETARIVEGLGIKAGVRSATETIVQILEGVTKGKKVPAGVKLQWAKKPDASARKQYAVKLKTKVKAKAKHATKAKVAAPKHAAKPAAKPRKVKHKIARKPEVEEATPAIVNGAVPHEETLTA